MNAKVVLVHQRRSLVSNLIIYFNSDINNKYNISFIFTGVWEVPLNAHFIESYEGGHCPYLDQCVLHNSDAEEVFEWLQEDFARHYEQNKAPYMMPFHTNWFQIKELEEGLHKFLDWAQGL